MRGSFILSVMLCFSVCFGQTAKEINTPKELVADNGKLTVKFDLTRGGAISWISNPDHNVVW